MRLDIFLKSTRLIQRRTMVQQFCEAGLVSVNGVKAKSSKDIKIGDEIVIARPTRLTSLRVLGIPTQKQVSKDYAKELYQILSEEAPPQPEE